MKGKPLYDYCLENPNMMYLLDEWVYDKNECELGFTPYNTSYGSDKKVYWRCFECGKTYIARVKNRIHGCNCSFCKNSRIGESNRRRALDRGSLASCRPDLLEEWDYNKNKISPEEVPVGSHLKVYWKCKICGYSWEAIVFSRTKAKNSSGCPNCDKEKHSSFSEQAIYYYLKKVYKEVINSSNNLLNSKLELDIYIPEIKTAVEYDGLIWHKDVNRDLKKNKLCKENGIRLIRIREKGLSNVVGSINLFREENSSVASLENVLKRLFLLLNVKVNINIERDRQEIYSQYIKSVKENSLAVKFPEIAKEWHPTKNGNITPENVSFASNKSFVWLCEKGHEWKAIVNSRTRGAGCPYCSGRYAIRGKTDLCTVNPELASEWNFDKNKSIFPDSVSAGCNDIVWWKCKTCGYEWEAQINSRNRGNGCPNCRPKKIGEALIKRASINGNDLASNYPELLKEWDYEKNDILPSDVAKYSEKVVWWKCKLGHSWQSAIVNRSKGGSGCIYCSGYKVLSGFNDLCSTHPEIAKEWHPTKNDNLLPSMVSKGCEKVVWWLCAKGHEWKASVSNRTYGRGCPYCSGKKVLKGYNDLCSTHSELAREWHPTKNGDLTPDKVSVGSRKKVWWRCEKGHEWEAFVYSRRTGVGCPYCSGRKALKGYNDLATLCPEVIKEWHPIKNGDLTPDKVTKGSGKKVWWLCDVCGHEYLRDVYTQVATTGIHCPECAKKNRKS